MELSWYQAVIKKLGQSRAKDIRNVGPHLVAPRKQKDDIGVKNCPYYNSIHICSNTVVAAHASKMDKYMLLAGWEVRIGKNCDRGLENAARGHSFSLYGSTLSRPMTFLSFILAVNSLTSFLQVGLFTQLCH